MKPLSYDASLEFLYGLVKSGIKLGLDRTVNLLENLGNPERYFDSVHIAGTNGKGSVACFLHSILYRAGLVTGLFTSPHLVSYRERIRINGSAIGRRELADLVSDLRSAILETGVTYFEATTVLAFEHFRRCAVDVAVVEVGMGGRLDSTNVLEPLVTCITSIDYDHTLYLGRTLAKIAAEKAGTIKAGIPVVCGRIRKPALASIMKTARSKRAKVYLLGRDATCGLISSDLSGSTFEYRGLSTRQTFRIRVAGLHQVDNAALAVLVAEVLRERGIKIGDRAIAEGLLGATWPGRLEILRRRPLLVCDAAHNVSGMHMLVTSLKAFNFRPDVIVFGVLRDKRYEPMLKMLARSGQVVVLTKPASPRALSLAKLKEVCRHLGLRAYACARSGDAISKAFDLSGRRGKILVCGSIYLLGEVMESLNYHPSRINLCQ